jgi:hypothetical protein
MNPTITARSAGKLEHLFSKHFHPIMFTHSGRWDDHDAGLEDYVPRLLN